jgi:hypothetical protein
MKHLFALIALWMVLFSSCKKETVETEEPSSPILNYMPLTTGSFWVFEDFRIDSLGDDIKMNKRDSMWVAYDSLINNQTYAVIKGSYFPFGNPISPDSIIMLLRDSSGYLINAKGSIEFAAPNLTDTIDSGIILAGYDTLYEWHSKMDPTVHSITVPAGAFNTLDFPKYYFSDFPVPPPNPRIQHKYMAKNVGIVLSSYSYSSNKNTYFEKRLVNYYIAN